MAFDEKAADRIRAALGGRPGLTEKRMFGGIAFMLNGNMCCGVQEDRLMLRLGNEGAAEALKHKHVRPMDFTGRPLKSMVYVDPQGFRTPSQLRKWIDRAVAFAEELAPK